ncbi:hypothetical protein G3N18_09895 [Microbacterium sp. 2C]|uniref:NotI family restriction endonuclease n=1 Tax=Microbacterium paulum TaxID=2707006 RepID=UPI0018C32B1F|nr:hypothetical protein [Microbacterium paulum]
MKQVVELFGTRADADGDWSQIVADQVCPFDHKKCYKTRKSNPEISIGTCTVQYPVEPIMICPKRMIDGGKIFRDVLHLLPRHEPGNDYHLIPEFSVPGGSIDFVVASVKGNDVVDFVGVELQTLDTTGTVWPARQRLLIEKGVIDPEPLEAKSYGMNWKMTAKTILVQMHHKAETFANLDRHLVLVVQDRLVSYMQNEFDFDHFSNPAVSADTVQIHGYGMPDRPGTERLGLALSTRISTDVAGIERSLGLRGSAVLEEESILGALADKVSESTLFNPLVSDVPASASLTFPAAEVED